MRISQLLKQLLNWEAMEPRCNLGSLTWEPVGCKVERELEDQAQPTPHLYLAEHSAHTGLITV
jgi:hypothetical protein